MAARHVLPISAVGTYLPPVRSILSQRRLMSYAAALGATEDVYMNDLRPEGIVALPSFVVSPEWEIMNGSAYRAILNQDDAGMWRCIHVQQDTRFISPITPGLCLVTQGFIGELRSTKIGTYVAVRLRMSREDNGALLAESWFCGIFLDAQLDGVNSAVATAPTLDKLKAEDFSLPSVPMFTISRALPHLYTEAAEIWNPIHTERRAAKDAGLKDTLLHGTYSWGAAGLQLIRIIDRNNPTRLRRLAGRMTGKALIGNELRLQYHQSQIVKNSVKIIFRVLDQTDAVIIDGGIAEFE